MVNLLEVLYLVIASTALIALFHRMIGQRREAAYFAALTAGFAIVAAVIYWLLLPNE
jgi:hypothetical protein